VSRRRSAGAVRGAAGAGRASRWSNVDLHAHSTASDGVLSPADLVRRAHAGGVDLFALTDHDELAGVAEAARAAEALGMGFVAGVEISVTWAGETVHVLGLGVDPDSETLRRGLAQVRSGRDARAREIGAQLGSAGIPGAYEAALAHAGNRALVSRTHFARHLVETGACRDMDEVFRRFLIEGKPGYVAHRWARLDDAMRWIRAAGGTPVLAHPARYAFDDTALWAMIGAFRDLGGLGIEVVCGSHLPDEYARFARVAAEFGLLASRGSDFHAPGESRADPGRLPALPGGLRPVWEAWA